MRRSPLTLAGHTEVVRVISVASIIQGWRDQLGIDVAPEFRGHETVELRRCRDTGLEFFVPEDLAGSPALYSQLQRQAWYYQTDKWEHAAALDMLTPGQRLLEIGAGDGAFVTRARERDVRATAIESNPQAVARAREKGVSVELASLEEYAERGADPFDVVCAFQVLEHVPDPRVFLEQIAARLCPGGRALLSVPNSDSYIRHLDEGGLLNMPPHHMTRWRRKVFARLPSSIGFSLDWVGYEPLAVCNVENYLMALKVRFARRGLRALVEHPAVEWRLRRALRFLAPRIRGQSMLVRLLKDQ